MHHPMEELIKNARNCLDRKIKWSEDNNIIIMEICAHHRSELKQVVSQNIPHEWDIAIIKCLTKLMAKSEELAYHAPKFSVNDNPRQIKEILEIYSYRNIAESI